MSCPTTSSSHRDRSSSYDSSFSSIFPNLVRHFSLQNLLVFRNQFTRYFFLSLFLTFTTELLFISFFPFFFSLLSHLSTSFFFLLCSHYSMLSFATFRFIVSVFREWLYFTKLTPKASGTFFEFGSLVSLFSSPSTPSSELNAQALVTSSGTEIKRSIPCCHYYHQYLKCCYHYY